MAGRQQAQAEAASGSERNLVAPAVFAQLAGEAPRRAAYQELWTAHAQLGMENGQLRQRMEELERQAGLHSRNSGVFCTFIRSIWLTLGRREAPAGKK